MIAVRVTEKAATSASIDLKVTAQERPRAQTGQCVIEVKAAGVNPSDVKAVLGHMPYAVWPRTPGRDYAGVVIEGPAGLVGNEVWGSGGELGIRRDGTHAGYLVVDAATVRAKPASVSLVEAGAVGVPFVTAYEGFRRAGFPKAGDVVLVFGGNGKVGQAAIQLATSRGARVFAVERTREDYRGHATGPVDMIDASAGEVAAYVRAKTGGHGADIVFNTVGSPYFEQANHALALRGRQIFIATIDRAVPFDIFTFFRGQHTYVGVDTLALDSAACAEILDELAPGFTDGSLKPFPVDQESIFAFAQATHAYRAVIEGTRNRVVLQP